MANVIKQYRVHLIIIIVAVAASLGFSFILGTHAHSLVPLEYVKWIEDEENGLKASKTAGDYTYMLQYKPIEYVVLLDKKDPQLSQKSLLEGIEEYRGLQYYTFTIGRKNGGQLLNENESRIGYFSSEMQKDIYLVEAGDTLPCVLFHFEPAYSMKPVNNFVLAFEDRNEGESNRSGSQKPVNKTFIYKDRLWNAGQIVLEIKGNDLQNIPELKTLEYVTENKKK